MRKSERAPLIEKAYSLYTEGKTTGEISEIMGVHRKTIIYWLKKKGVTEFHWERGFPQNIKEDVLDSYWEGENIDDICEEFGVSRTTIRNWIREEKDRHHEKGVFVFDPEAIIVDFIEGMTLEKLMEKYGACVETIKTILMDARTKGNTTIALYMDKLNEINFKIDDIQRELYNKIYEPLGEKISWDKCSSSECMDLARAFYVRKDDINSIPGTFKDALETLLTKADMLARITERLSNVIESKCEAKND